jgi:hypothetical protein
VQRQIIDEKTMVKNELQPATDSKSTGEWRKIISYVFDFHSIRT